jgi:glycosyltransferase involved in cell wall biosynthesis
MHIQVSIIIPAKNEGIHLGNCLQSLSLLDFPKDQYEVIVADNGSEDSTRNIAKSYNAQIVCVPAGTIAAVRNAGAAQAKGDILVFLDADCTVARDWLKKAELYFYKKDLACFGSSPIIPENSTWVEQTWFLVRECKEETFEREWQESTNMFVPKRIFEQVGGFNEKLTTCEDVDLSYRLAKFGKILADKRIVAIHHRDPKTIKEFFLKEKWRGASNYSGLLQHGLKISELPSLLLPLYFVGMLIMSLGALAMGAFVMAGVLFLAGQFPVMGLTFIKIRRQFKFSSYFRLLVLYNIYFMARAGAIF